MSKKVTYNGGGATIGPRGFSSIDPADPRGAKTIISVEDSQRGPRPAKGETWEDIKHLLPKGFVIPLPKPKAKGKKRKKVLP